MSQTPQPAVRPQPVSAEADLSHPALYFNRELGWLDFNWRVFRQAEDASLPLIERVRFLAITAGNLDEFVQKRVGGLRRQEAAGVVQPSPDGRRPAAQLDLVRDEVTRMQVAMDRLWREELRPALESSAGVRISSPASLGPIEQAHLRSRFREEIYPLLTPLAVDPGHPFPFISNLSLSLAVELRDPVHHTSHLARVKIPTAAARWMCLPGSSPPVRLVPIEEVVRRHVGDLFGSMALVGAHLFRVTRNADVRRDEEEAEDLLAMISEELRERRFAPVVRLEVERCMPMHIRDLLRRELGLAESEIVETEGPLALTDLSELADLDLDHGHRFDPWDPVVPADLVQDGTAEADGDMFSVIRRGDVLVHHPYESFRASVQRLIEEAAADPEVLAIKQTLYRTSEGSPVVRALQQAASRGKEVAVLVEVKARFDEQNNMEWARVLEDSGAHVTYGVVGLKTHAKVLLVVRREEGRPRAYCHIGTGNYHSRNARIYTDLGLLTCDPEVGADVVDLFHFLTGHAPGREYRSLLVAPTRMRTAFERLVDREIAHARSGGSARIAAKMNALDDPATIRRLYAASQAGVRIDLVVRGHCQLRPGVRGYSENIRVVSLIGRFLEHDRVFLFENGGNPEVFLGSADWRTRNLDERVEVVVPIREPALRDRLVRLLDAALSDNDLAWRLEPDGRYVRKQREAGEEVRNLHRTLMMDAAARRKRPADTASLPAAPPAAPKKARSANARGARSRRSVNTS